MFRTFGILLLLVLAGCASVAPPQAAAPACAGGESSYACQVERYHNVNVQ